MTTVSASTSDAEAARVLFDRQALDLRTATTGIVVAVNDDGSVDVQPAISMTQILDGERRTVPMPVVRAAPLHLYGSTVLGLFVVPPVTVGDDGMLIVSDRALDNWQFGDGTAPTPAAPSPRHHDLTDAMFIPGLQRAGGALPAMPTDALTLRNRSGSTQLQVRDSGVTIIGNLTVAGAVTASSVTAAGIPLATHVHSLPGGPNTGGPQA